MTRHAASTRLWHWVNALSVIALAMSGLNISNAHPWLYWGQWGFEPAKAWLGLPRFPGWITLPGHYSLAEARLWHLALAWLFGAALLGFLLAGTANGHFRRDFRTSRAELRWSAIREDIARHLRLDFDHGSAKFNLLQKAAYGIVLFGLLPLMIVTGLAMSPGIDANWPWLLDLLGGRQTARSLHFVTASLLVAFLFVHLAMVGLSGPVRQMRTMIFGGEL